MKRTILKVGAPLVAILTLMLGLRIGAGEAVRAATLFGAPPARKDMNGNTRLAWQLLTFVDDRGVKETVAMNGLSAIARSKGREYHWSGKSNGDGIAEVWLEIEGLAHGDPLDIEVRIEGEKEPLAAGRVAWGPDHQADQTVRVRPGGAVRPTVRNGAIGMDVVIEGERLIAGFPTSLWVRVTPPPGIAATGLVIEAEPEPGLLPARDKATTCGAGWAEFPMTAMAHVTGAGFEVRAEKAPGSGLQAPDDAGADAGDAGGPRGEARASGKWFGALPVAAGAFFISTPRVLPAWEPTSVVLIAPNPRDVVYAELDDTHGRAAAAALPVAVEPGDPTPRARFALPPLAPGLYWLVVSGEPRGAERLAGAAVAKAILVGDGRAGLEDTGDSGSSINVQDACSVGPWLAQRPAPGFPRWVALDGLPARSASNTFRHNLGLAIGIVSLLAAGILETLLLIAASREARIALQLAELDEDEAAKKVTAKPPGGGLVVALLIAIMGFALLAVLLVLKA